MCLTNDQIEEYVDTDDDRSVFVLVALVYLLFGAVIGFIGGYSVCKVATAQTVSESFSKLTGEVNSVTVEYATGTSLLVGSIGSITNEVHSSETRKEPHE